MRALLLLLTACWGTTQSAAPQAQPTPEPVASSAAFRARPPKNTCQRTITAASDKLRPEFSKTGIPEATIDELVEAAIESCRAMDWSPDLLACYDNIGDSNELTGCQSLMTPEQSEDVSRRWMDVVQRMSQQMVPPPPTP